MGKFLLDRLLELYRNPFSISIIIGLVLLIIGYTDAVFESRSDSSWIAFYRTVGTLMFSSGIFVALVKSNQFISIFGDVLRKIVYSDEHLQKRKDLPELWEKVSIALCKQKFNSLSKDLHKNIKDYYLPIDHEFYYKDYEVDLDIEYDTSNPDYIIIQEETKTTIVSDDDKKKIDYIFEIQIPIPRDDNDLTYYELTELSVNGIIFRDKKDLTVTRSSKLLHVKFKKPCNGKDEYVIIRKERKRYNLKVNPFRGHLAVWLYKNFTIKVTYPKSLHIQWLDIGVLDKWVQNKKENNNYKVLKASYQGLIFKKQGFVLFFRK